MKYVTHKRTSAEQIAAIYEAQRTGKSTYAISKELGLSYGKTRYWYKRAQRGEPPGPKKKGRPIGWRKPAAPKSHIPAEDPIPAGTLHEEVHALRQEINQLINMLASPDSADPALWNLLTGPIRQRARALRFRTPMEEPECPD